MSCSFFFFLQFYHTVTMSDYGSLSICPAWYMLYSLGLWVCAFLNDFNVLSLPILCVFSIFFFFNHSGIPIKPILDLLIQLSFHIFVFCFFAIFMIIRSWGDRIRTHFPTAGLTLHPRHLVSESGSCISPLLPQG